MVSLDELVGPAGAVIHAFSPGMRGGEALWRAMAGADNRWGRLPITFYTDDFNDLADV
jgi:hypothetical protein